MIATAVLPKTEKLTTDDKEIYDVIVIGGGSAGCTAGIYAARAGLKTLLLIGPTPGGQIASAHQVDNYPGFPDGVNGLDLALLFEQQAARLGVEIARTTVKTVELAGEIKTVHTRKVSYCAYSVIIATGASARKLGVPGEDELRGAGVSYCATCDGGFAKGKQVVVIGGGDTALGDAAYLARIADEVTIIHRRDSFRAAKLTQDIALSNDNVRVIWDSGVDSFVGQNGKLVGVNLKNLLTGEVAMFPIDNAFVAVGNDPQTAFLEGQVELDGGFVVADAHGHASQPGVFAAGDVRLGAERQVVVAAADGAVAAIQASAYLDQLRAEGAGQA